MNNYFLLLISILQLGAFILFLSKKDTALGFVQLFACLANLSMFFVRGEIK